MLAQVGMPSGAEEYRGYTIYWDAIPVPGINPWKAKAGVMSPPDSSGVPSTIVGITGDRFKSESEARDYVLQVAKKRVDEIVEGKTAQQRMDTQG